MNQTQSETKRSMLNMLMHDHPYYDNRKRRKRKLKTEPVPRNRRCPPPHTDISLSLYDREARNTVVADNRQKLPIENDATPNTGLISAALIPVVGEDVEIMTSKPKKRVPFKKKVINHSGPTHKRVMDEGEKQVTTEQPHVQLPIAQLQLSRTHPIIVELQQQQSTYQIWHPTFYKPYGPLERPVVPEPLHPHPPFPEVIFRK